MKMPNALTPYLSLIKLGAVAVIAGFLFIGGCNYGQNSNEKELSRVENNLLICQQANASWAEAADERNAQVEANAKEGERLQKQASKGNTSLADSRKDTDKLILSNEQKLQQAVRDPKCNEVLELTLCPTVPLP